MLDTAAGTKAPDRARRGLHREACAGSARRRQPAKRGAAQGAETGPRGSQTLPSR